MSGIRPIEVRLVDGVVHAVLRRTELMDTPITNVEGILHYHRVIGHRAEPVIR